MFKFLVPPFVVLFLFGFSLNINDKTLIAENNISTSTEEHIPYSIRVHNKSWTPPVYSSEWDSPWLVRRFGDKGIKKAIASIYSHRLFKVPLSLSERIEFYSITQMDRNEQGKFPKLERSHDHVGFYIFGAAITDVKKVDNNIGFIVKPTNSGYQEIWVPKKYLSEKANYKMMTPDGYVLDQMPYNRGYTN